MKAHTWIVEEVNCGHLGVNDFFKCTGCGAAGGPADFPGSKPWVPCFLACGCVLELPADCTDAFIAIRAHLVADCPRHDSSWDPRKY